MFAPTPGAGSTGLELLASAALAHPGGGDTLATPNPSLALTGPFNPAASVQTEVFPGQAAASSGRALNR